MAFGNKKEKTTSATGAVSVPTDGRVHATVSLISMTAIGEAWGRGNALDAQLQDLQDQGAEILSVMPYVTADSGKNVKAIITFRAPMVDDLRPGY